MTYNVFGGTLNLAQPNTQGSRHKPLRVTSEAAVAWKHLCSGVGTNSLGDRLNGITRNPEVFSVQTELNTESIYALGHVRMMHTSYIFCTLCVC